MISVEGDFVRTGRTGEGEFGIKRGKIGVLAGFGLFLAGIHYMDIVIWISIAPLYKTTSKFFHVKFFIVPLKLLDTLHKHRYNVECKIV